MTWGSNFIRAWHIVFCYAYNIYQIILNHFMKNKVFCYAYNIYHIILNHFMKDKDETKN